MDKTGVVVVAVVRPRGRGPDLLGRKLVTRFTVRLCLVPVTISELYDRVAIYVRLLDGQVVVVLGLMLCHPNYI